MSYYILIYYDTKLYHISCKVYLYTIYIKQKQSFSKLKVKLS